MLLDIASAASAAAGSPAVIDLPRCLVGHEENVKGNLSTFHVEENMER